MGDFQRGGNRGGGFRGGDRGGRPSFGGGRGGDRGPVTMFKAVCDECHKPCEVPFRPSNDKPIFCNECFSSKRTNDDRGPKRDFGDRGPKRDFGDKQAPSFNKPAGSSDDLKNQLREISSKLDRLLNVIEKTSQPKAEVKPVVKSAPVVTPKIEVKKAPAKKVVAKVEIKKPAVKKVVAKAPAKKVVAKKKTK